MTPPILGIWASQISGHLWAPAGAYDALATVTVPSGGAASITFAGIPTGYKHLQIRMIARSSATGTGGIDTPMQFNGDTTAGNYKDHQIYGDGSTAGASVANSAPSPTSIYPAWIPKDGNTVNAFAGYVLDILDYANTSKNKTTRSIGGWDANGSGFAIFRSGLWMSTSAINQITFTVNSGNFTQYSQFALFGVK